MKMISIVSPCFNEQDNVEQCRNAVRALFAGELREYTYEHIFSDNGSTDRTPELLRELAANDPHVKVILNARNFGLFRSTFNAIRYANGDAVLLMLPVDLQDPPAMIPEFVRLWESGYEVVAGARVEREEGLMMRTARRIFYGIVNRLAEFEIPENVGEFQLVDRKVVDVLRKTHDQYPYIRGLVASAGFRRVIVPYTWIKRERGKSNMRLFSLIDQAMNGIFAFTSAPMRFCTLIGFALAVVCLLWAAVVGVLHLVQPTAAPRGVTSLIVSLFFFSSVQLSFIGILGEYVTAIHAQVRRGPIVIERERINL